MRELDFIEWICRQSTFDPALAPVGPGDDCAIVNIGRERALVTIDQVLDGVHIDLARHGPQAAGRKAMARSLSDVAAMAAEPFCAVASVALPKGFDRRQAEAVYTGLRSIAETFACLLVGGDVASWAGPVAVSVALIARPGGIEPVLRSGAKAGDVLCVTGALGGAWQSGRDLTFTPRLSEARALAGRFDLHAMIDLSDGLARDLHHLCAASGVGAEIVAADIPVHADAADLAAALGDGEDYELLFALPPHDAETLLAEQPLDVPVRPIGTVTAGSEIVLIETGGALRPLGPAGWEHTT